MHLVDPALRWTRQSKEVFLQYPLFCDSLTNTCIFETLWCIMFFTHKHRKMDMETLGLLASGSPP